MDVNQMELPFEAIEAKRLRKQARKQERRKERYRTDPAYRAKMIARAKARYGANKEHCIATQRKWAIANPERANWKKRNPERAKVHEKRWREQHPNYKHPPRVRKQYTAEEKAVQRAKRIARYNSDPAFRISILVRCRTAQALKSQNARKTSRTVELLGCSIPELRAHLEAQFAPGMSWENYGRYGWHIDHIKPCAAFDLSDEAQQYECFHYSNLQPLWETDNLRKSDKYEPSELRG